MVRVSPLISATKICMGLLPPAGDCLCFSAAVGLAVSPRVHFPAGAVLWARQVSGGGGAGGAGARDVPPFAELLATSCSWRVREWGGSLVVPKAGEIELALELRRSA